MSEMEPAGNGMDVIDLHWQHDAGTGGDPKVLSGNAKRKGHLVHVADKSFSKGIIKLEVLVEAAPHGQPFAVGVCTGNFTRQIELSGPSGQSPLASSHHAICLQSDGAIFVKGAPSQWALPALTEGTAVTFTLNFLKRELQIHSVLPVDEERTDERNVILPFALNEVTLAATMAQGEQRLRVGACEASQLNAALTKGKSVPDLWDDENTIEPLDLERKRVDINSTLASVAQSCS